MGQTGETMMMSQAGPTPACRELTVQSGKLIIYSYRPGEVLGMKSTEHDDSMQQWTLSAGVG